MLIAHEMQLRACFWQGVYYPNGLVLGRLRHHTGQVVLQTDDGAFPFQTAGSCLLICAGKRYLAIMTEHQVKGAARENVSLVSNKDSLVFSSRQKLYIEHQDEWEDIFDVATYDFTKAVDEGLIARWKFLTFSPDSFIQDGDEVLHGFASGYLTSDQIYDVDNEVPQLSHFGSRQRDVFCQSFTGFAASDTLSVWRTRDSPSVLDGLSGAPMFATVARGNVFFTRLVGLVVRGGHSQVYVARSRLIRQMIQEKILTSNKR